MRGGHRRGKVIGVKCVCVPCSRLPRQQAASRGGRHVRLSNALKMWFLVKKTPGAIHPLCFFRVVLLEYSHAEGGAAGPVGGCAALAAKRLEDDALRVDASLRRNGPRYRVSRSIVVSRDSELSRVGIWAYRPIAFLSPKATRRWRTALAPGEKSVRQNYAGTPMSRTFHRPNLPVKAASMPRKSHS